MVVLVQDEITYLKTVSDFGREACISISHSDCVVIIPTYNECENISRMITALKSLPYPVDILVVDDNSPDGTANVVREKMQFYDGVYLLHREKKEGLGKAYKAGFQFALRGGWEYICQMDADFSHNPKDVMCLLHECQNGSDIVIGSRYVKGGKTIGWPLKRRIISKIANIVAKILLRIKIDDITAGFKCFTRSALEKINVNQIESEGYIFQVEVNHRARCENIPVKQIPISFTDRTRGESKLGRKEAKQGLIQLFKLSNLYNRNL